MDNTHSSLDRTGIYAALGVPQVWRFDGQTLRVFCLALNGEYEERDHSPTFPMLPLDRMADFGRQSMSTDDVTLARTFRDWLRGEILPRQGA